MLSFKLTFWNRQRTERIKILLGISVNLKCNRINGFRSKKTKLYHQNDVLMEV